MYIFHAYDTPPYNTAKSPVLKKDRINTHGVDYIYTVSVDLNHL